MSYRRIVESIEVFCSGVGVNIAILEVMKEGVLDKEFTRKWRR